MSTKLNPKFHALLWKASIGYNDSWSQIDPEVLNNFGNLIVQECSDLVDNKELITPRQTYDDNFVAMYNTKEMLSKQILDHFGVEP